MTNASKERIELIVNMVADYGAEQTCEALSITRATLDRYMRQVNSGIEEKSVLLFDIETAPYEGYFFDRWKQNISMSMVKEDWSVLCWAAKWLDKPDMTDSCSWRTGACVRDDKACMLALHGLLSQADIVVAHNGDKFDIKRVNARFVKHGLEPPKPFKSVDTLKIAKKKFAFPSNRLDDLGEFLGVGRKVKHEGFEMWRKVLDGDPEAQDKMLEYNIGDIILLEQVYLKLRPWDHGHPNVNLDYTVKRCTVCGSPHLARDGEVCTGVSTFAAYQCVKCGHWMRGKVNLKDKDEMNRTMRNAI